VGLAAATPAPGEINATLHSLGPSGDAKCLDGSPAAFYLRPGTGSGASKWVVFHEGGGWCISLSDCRARANTTLGSSVSYAAELAMPDQLLSSNATINPLLHNWNVAYLTYCDGGSFVGDAVANDTQGALHFRGRAIKEATLAALLAHHELASASEVVISGGSAGGLAAFIHADWWCDAIRAATNGSLGKCAALPDSGFFLDYESPRATATPPPAKYKGGYFRAYMDWAFDAFNASGGLHSDCVTAMANHGTPNLCMFAEHTAPFIHTPLFALQSEYDSWQRYFVIDSMQDAQALGDNITTRLMAGSIDPHPENGAFISACGYHTGGWSWLKIDGDWQHEAFASWYTALGSGNTSRKRVWHEVHTYPCAACCKAVGGAAPSGRGRGLRRTATPSDRGLKSFVAQPVCKNATVHPCDMTCFNDCCANAGDHDQAWLRWCIDSSCGCADVTSGSCVCPSCNATYRSCTDDRDCDQDPGCSEWQCFFGTHPLQGSCAGPLPTPPPAPPTHCAGFCKSDADCRNHGPGCGSWQCSSLIAKCFLP